MVNYKYKYYKYKKKYMTLKESDDFSFDHLNKKKYLNLKELNDSSLTRIDNKNHLQLRNSNLTNLEFPYYKYYNNLTLEKFNSLINNNKLQIQNYIPKKIKNKKGIEKLDDKFVFIQLNYKKNKNIDNLSNYFNEHCRIKCQFRNFSTPYDYWNNHKKKLIEEYNNSSKNKNPIKFLRSKVYKGTRDCTTFRVSVCLTVLKMFNAKKWLDISAGWGDRLLSAIGHGVDLYCGVDPNSCVHEGYNKIIDKLVPNNEKHKYILLKGGFEEVKLPDEKFDLVFTSPPFFDIETYSEEESDSLVKFSDGDLWFENFLMKSIKKAIKYLEPNGHLILYISEGKKYRFLDKMREQTNKLLNYKGMFYYYYDDRYIARSFFIWQK